MGQSFGEYSEITTIQFITYLLPHILTNLNFHALPHRQEKRMTDSRALNHGEYGEANMLLLKHLIIKKKKKKI